MTKKTIFVLVLIIVLIFFAYLSLRFIRTRVIFETDGQIYQSPTPVQNNVTTFDDCVAAGNPVMESYPRQCNAGGKTFVENIGNANEKADLIVVDSPRPNEEVASPLTISGKARGNWYFEASFPIYLYDSEGREIARVVAQAEEEWMTTEFVPFSITLDYDKPMNPDGELVLRKDNPSGLPENDDQLVIPLKLF